ncbi:MAG: AmmeMemoRadiSam system protein A [Clostridia bacterium]|nr:AmmeMemoRadiSam system protein A [Clostridia bacterium]
MAIVGAFMVPHPPMIVPDIGCGRERMIEETKSAYVQVAREIAECRPETILIASPHSVMYADYFHISPGSGAKGSFQQFEAGHITFKETYDEKLVNSIQRLAKENGVPAGTRGERRAELDHGTMVPLYFIRQFWNDFKLVRIGLSGLSLEEHYRLGQIIGQAVQETERRAVFVASGDLSHKLRREGPYGFAPEGPQYDARIMDVCGRAAFDELLDFDESFCERAAECGHRSFVMMAGALDGRTVNVEKLSHQDITGVGYGICAFHPQGNDPERKFLEKHREKEKVRIGRQREASDAWVNLARQAIERYVMDRQTLPVPENLPGELLHSRAGAFVSIHKQGRLRGCIGTIGPVRDCLADEIIHNAISAAVSDYRFEPIQPEELEWLEINVDVLSEPEDIDSEDELDVRKYGVIVSHGNHRGLLLPDLDGVDTVEEQVSIARKKAGIGPKEKVRLQRFQVIRHR